MEEIKAAIDTTEKTARGLFLMLADTPFDSWREWLTKKHSAEVRGVGDHSAWIKNTRALPIVQKTRRMAVSYQKYGEEIMVKSKKIPRSAEERKMMADEWFTAWSRWFFDLGLDTATNTVHEGVLMYVMMF
jgi:hypothetical protein